MTVVTAFRHCGGAAMCIKSKVRAQGRFDVNPCRFQALMSPNADAVVRVEAASGKPEERRCSRTISLLRHGRSRRSIHGVMHDRDRRMRLDAATMCAARRVCSQ